MPVRAAAWCGRFRAWCGRPQGLVRAVQGLVRASATAPATAGPGIWRKSAGRGGVGCG